MLTTTKRLNFNAIADYNQAIKLKHDFAEVYALRGSAYSEKADLDRAIADFKKTLELTKEPKIRQDVEKVLKELGVK